TFVRLIGTLGAYRDLGRFEPWLFRVAANLARDRIRRSRRRPASSAAEDVLADPLDHATPPAIDPHEMLERSEAADRLNAALERLPAGEREVVLLRHFSSLSFKEIADVMDTPIGTALARAHRGLARLRGMMDAASIAGGATPADAAHLDTDGSEDEPYAATTA
ncbi:MAG: sigma-70 family RNA polymerase sigma factor, partial [Phycisphaerae bacterium]